MNDPSISLFRAWRAALPAAQQQLDARGAAEQLARVVQEAAAAWPQLAIDPGELAAHIGRVTPARAEPLAHLRQLDAADLSLAFACAQSDAAALSLFNGAMAADLRMVYAQARGPKPPFDEYAQVLQTKLLTGPSPRIGRYAGLGALKNWVRVSAARVVIDLQRLHDSDYPSEEALLSVPAPEDDPETQYLKRLYRSAMRDAFEAAAAELTAEQRNCLRDYYARRLTVDQLASARGIHRATAARRVAAARGEVLRLTRQLLMQRTQLSRDELASVVRLIESQLYVSVERVFANEA